MNKYMPDDIVFSLNKLAEKLNITETVIKSDGIYIQGNVPSKKNKKIWTGKRLISSKIVLEYEKTKILHYKDLKDAMPTTTPLLLGMYFIRKDRRVFDYNNISQIVLDMLVTANVITDDNASLLVPVFLGYSVDKKNAGVIILPLR